MILARATQFGNYSDENATTAADWRRIETFCKSINELEWFQGNTCIVVAPNEREAAEHLAGEYLRRLRAMGLRDPKVSFVVEYVRFEESELQWPITGRSSTRFRVTDFEVQKAVEAVASR